MKATISNSLLSKLKPQLKHYDVWDGKLGGFHLRVNPNEKMVYRCAYARNKIATIGKAGLLSPAQARDRAKQILGDAAMSVRAIALKFIQILLSRSLPTQGEG